MTDTLHLQLPLELARKVAAHALSSASPTEVYHWARSLDQRVKETDAENLRMAAWRKEYDAKQERIAEELKMLYAKHPWLHAYKAIGIRQVRGEGAVVMAKSKAAAQRGSGRPWRLTFGGCSTEAQLAAVKALLHQPAKHRTECGPFLEEAPRGTFKVIKGEDL